jgi:hypothetical protein
MLRPIVFVACVAAALAGCKPPAEQLAAKPMQEFVSQAGRFKVKMPGPPESTTQDVNYKVGGQTIRVSIAMHQVQAGSEGYAVGVADMPKVPFMSAIETRELLERSRDGAISNTGSTLESSKSALLQNQYQGLEFSAKMPPPPRGVADGVVRGRIYLVGSRLYQLYAMGAPALVNDPRTAEFFDSFKVSE